jgi:hypothetical protein
MIDLSNRLHPTVPRGLSVAFYKGVRPGISGLYNRLGRHLDRGPYSHCEMVFSNGLSGSSSYVDKGVRFKLIGYSSVGYWDFLPLPSTLEDRAFAWMHRHQGLKYDILGNLRFASNFARDSEDKWFCSEAIMSMSGFPEAYRFGPSGAATMLQHHFNAEMVHVNS